MGNEKENMRKSLTLNGSMNNVMQQNRHIDNGELNENINENFQNLRRRNSLPEHPIEFGIQKELTEEKIAGLKEQLENLDKEISFLGNAENMKFNLPKEESEWSANFVARYKNRNSLVKAMTRRIRFVKERLNKGISGADISKIEKMIEETQNTNQQIYKEDYELALWKSYTNNIKEIDDTMDAILKDTHLNDSTYYDDIVNSIKKYRENPTQKNMKELQNYLKVYIDIRTRHGRKKEEDFREKGRIRIRRMKLLAKKLGTIDNFNKYKETEESKIKAESTIQYEGTATKEALTARQRRNEEFLEINRKFKVLKDTSEILITERMLTPEYVKQNMEEMKGYIETIKKARDFRDEWRQKHQQGYEKNERGSLEEILYGVYWRKAEEVLKKNIGLEDFVHACEKGNANDIEKKREAITNKLLMKDEKVESVYKEYNKIHLNRLVRSNQVKYIVGAFDDNEKKYKLTAEADRLAGILEGYWMNDDGEFETDRDRKIFENNLEFVNLLYHGKLEELAPKVKEYFEEQLKYKVTKEMTTKDYILSHFSELMMHESRDTCKENIYDIREGLKDYLKKIMGGNYIDELFKDDIPYMSMYLVSFTQTLGFSHNTMQLLDTSYEGNLEEVEQEKQERLERVIEAIEKRDEKNKREQKRKRK